MYTRKSNRRHFVSCFKSFGVLGSGVLKFSVQGMISSVSAAQLYAEHEHPHNSGESHTRRGGLGNLADRKTAPCGGNTKALVIEGSSGSTRIDHFIDGITRNREWHGAEPSRTGIRCAAAWSGADNQGFVQI